MNELVKRISDNMLRTRPDKNIVYRPYIKYDALERRPLSYVTVDAGKLYPDAKNGDMVRVGTIIDVPYPNEAMLGVKGNLRVYLDGKELIINENGSVYDFH